MEYRVWSTEGNKKRMEYGVLSIEGKTLKSRHTRYAIHDTSSPARHTPYAIRHTLSRGFTLIELVVVMAIIIIVTSVTLANNSRFGGSIQLQNLAYDMALSIRQAQVYGISVRNYGAGNFNAIYGMHFDISDPTHYELFADTSSPPSGAYSSGETVPPSPYVIGRGYRIAGLCAPAGADSLTCARLPAGSQLDIVFRRPEPDARITAGNGLGQTCIQNTAECEENARIIIESPRGDILSVLVEATGQISVQ